MIRYGSVCSGVEAASLAWEPLGWTPAWFSEIDPVASGVLAYHWPLVPNLGDMLADDFVSRAKTYGHIDVLVGGTPCQSWSVAGKRGGIADPRGELTFRFLTIAKELNPEWIVWENVPGILSDKNDAFVVFLDALEESGYIADVDVLNAQFFGVPQRRRRVFVCAQSREGLLSAKTPSSALTISQCLAEILLLILIVLKNQSVTNLPDLAFDAGKPNRSLRRRMKLFSLEREGAAQILQENLDVLHRLYAQEQRDLESQTGKNGPGDLKISEGIKFPKLSKDGEAWREEFLSTGLLWRNTLEEILKIANECIISTPLKETIESKIYICAQLLVSIAAPIIQSMDCSPPFWSAVSSILTTLREFTNYARQASGDLFTEVEWIHNWHNFLRQAEPANIALSNLRTRQFGREVFPITPSLRGDHQTSGEAREEAPGDITPSLVASGRGVARAGDSRGQDPVIAVAMTASPVFASDGQRGHPGPESSDSLVCMAQNTGQGYWKESDVGETLRCSGKGGENRNANLAVFGGNKTTGPLCASDGKRGHSGPDASDGLVCMSVSENQRAEIRTSDVVPNLSTGGGKPGSGFPCIAFTSKDSGGDATEEISPTLRAGGHDKSHSNAGVPPAVVFNARQDPSVSGDKSNSLDTQGNSQGVAYQCPATNLRVRRLMPVETERLQGMPDGHTARTVEKELADGPRYKLVGNSMAVPVMRWIGRRIQAVIRKPENAA